MKKLSLTLSRNSLLTIYKTFVRLILDYADIIYDKPDTESFKDNIYRELGLESLVEQRWSRKIFFFHKIINGLLPVYLLSYFSYCDEGVYRTRSANQKNLRQFITRTKRSESSFFPYCIKEWNNLSEELRKSNKPFNSKQNFSVSSDPKKTQF